MSIFKKIIDFCGEKFGNITLKIKINTLNSEIEHLINKNNSLENIIKEKLYENFKFSLEAPKEIKRLKEQCKKYKEQRDNLRNDKKVIK